ncbi:MAG: hypothetical protein ACTSV6_07595 [Candidatus Heimdallarchaeota archaeon]
MSKQEEKVLRLLILVRDGLTGLVEKINEFLSEYEETKPPAFRVFDSAGKVVLEITEGKNKTEFSISQEKALPTTSAIVQNFLIKRVLKDLKRKGLTYELTTSEGKIVKITIVGKASAREIQRIRGAIMWTIRKGEKK